uniref:WD repeat-containing protein 55 homolog n=1 Tax=Anopheles farauti TaxID=69004 RepID=A0A182QCD8_9DIPT
MCARRNFHSPYFRDSSDSEDDADIDQFAAPYILVAGEDNFAGFALSDDGGDSYPAGGFVVMSESDSDNTYDEGEALDDDDSPMSDTSSESGSEQMPPVQGTSDEAKSGPSTGDGEGSKSNEEPVRRAVDDYNEELEDDDVIKAIIAEIKKPRSKPPNIQTEDFVVDLSFHPCEDVLAIGTSVGDVLMYKYTNEENVLAATQELHTKAVRCVEFSRDGKSLISTGRERSIVVMDVETGKFQRFWEAAHEEPVYSMAVISEQLFATGDDDGTVKLWDLRQRDAVFSLRPVEDFISCILANQAQQKYMLLTSGDGFLTTINLLQRKLYVQSEQYEEEMNCMGTFKRESKLVVGTSKGNYYTYNWGQFAYHCDAFVGPKASANRMVPITEQIAVMAGEDGILRAMHLVPGRVLGIVGQHPMAVDTLDISGNGELIATSSHDNDVRFWNIKYFEEFDGIKYNSKPDKNALKHNLPSSQRVNAKDFFAGLDE